MKTQKVICPHQDMKQFNNSQSVLEDLAIGYMNETGFLSNDSHIEWTMCDEEYGGPTYNFDPDCHEEKQVEARKRIDNILAQLGVAVGEEVVIKYWW